MARIVIVHGQTRASPAANHYLDGMQTYHHVRNRVCGRDRVYDDDPVDEGIRWLRGSRCWEGGRYGKGRQSPGTGILAYQRPVIWEYFKNNFIVPRLNSDDRDTLPPPLSFFSLSLLSPIFFSNPFLTRFLDALLRLPIYIYVHGTDTWV